MSTSLLYHAFGMRGCQLERTDFADGCVMFRVTPSKPSLRCPNCDSRRTQMRGSKERAWQTLPVGGRPVFARMAIPRVYCHDCKTISQMPVSFAVAGRSYTRAFQRYVLDLRKSMTVKDLAAHLSINQWKVKDIEKRYLKKHFDRPRLKDLRQIAVDEISIGRGHRYLTIVLDLETGAVVYVGKGKDAEALKPFWKRLRSSGAQIEAVAMDMSRAYIHAVRDNLPDAEIVFDRFHIMKLYNEKLSGLRRVLYREAIDQLHKDVLKGTLWLLLKNEEHLDDEKNERKRLDEALRLNQPLATAYYMKEELRQFWEQPNGAAAERFLNDWCARAEASGIRMLHKFANTLRQHRYGLLSWYDYPISTGPLEGTNNKIKTFRRQAYGFRDQEYFRLKIQALHETRYELVG